MKNITANAATASVIATAATIRKSSSIGGLPAAMTSGESKAEYGRAALQTENAPFCRYQEARAKSGDRREVKTRQEGAGWLFDQFITRD
jgi:hypothetical protein